jgi:hypothetical protein
MKGKHAKIQQLVLQIQKFKKGQNTPPNVRADAKENSMSFLQFFL